MMAVTLMIIGLTACAGDGNNGLAFESYESRNGDAFISIVIPQGEGERQQNVSKGIFEIMANSAIAKEVGLPKELSLKDVADDYSKRMAKLLESGDYGPATADLTIEASYLNEASAIFHVHDGVYVNGEPDVYDRVVRLSDGHVMEQGEMVNISVEDLQALIEKNLKEEMPVYLEDGYWVLPAGMDSCRVVWLISRAAAGEVMIPISEMEQYLAPDGKELFTAKPLEFMKSSGEDVEESNTETEEGGLVFNGKLGSVEVGKPMPSLPQSVERLYDKYTYKKIEHEGNDMDDPWTEEYYLFTKDGKSVFRANMSGSKVYSIYLMEGSSFIKTSDGIFVGYSARELFNKKRLEWTNYYDGTAFGSEGNYMYYINSDDLIRTDIPNKSEDFKKEAKIIGIAYAKD